MKTKKTKEAVRHPGRMIDLLQAMDEGLDVRASDLTDEQIKEADRFVQGGQAYWLVVTKRPVHYVVLRWGKNPS